MNEFVNISKNIDEGCYLYHALHITDCAAQGARCEHKEPIILGIFQLKINFVMRIKHFTKKQYTD